MPKTKDDFQPDTSGGFLDDADGDIIDAEFTEASGDYLKKMAMAEGSAKATPIGINLTIESPDLERPIEQWYSIGADDVWEIKNGGKEVVNIKHPDRHSFRGGKKPCRGMSLVEAMATAIGGGNVDKGQEFFIKRDKFMTEADFFVGLSFHWDRVALANVGEGTSDVPLPTSFLGEATKGKSKVKDAESADVTEDIEKLVSDAAVGLTERELKSKLIREFKDKIPETVMRDLVSGDGLKKLEDAGKLTLDQDKKYL